MSAESRDYKNTVFLPRTAFPMRAGLPAKEPEMLARWREMDLYKRVRAVSKGRPSYILHDGPPYANGNIHIGTALNKILKDVVNRSWQMLGYDADYVPGWDCHGLPIEWKIEERYRAAGKDKDEVPVVQFRQECREFATHWLGVQSGEFQRLGVLGNWETYYATMTFPAEAQIVREIHKFATNGGLYKGVKPVLWSVVERTALAEAEVEYKEHTSTTVWVRFPVITPSVPALEGADIVIWTTTPWTLPGNRAIAYGEEVTYGVYEVTETGDGSLAEPGDRLVVAQALAEQTQQQAKITGWTLKHSIEGAALAGTVCRHPLRGRGYDFDVRALAGDFVTTDTGTGFVHIAPGHGEDDFDLGSRHGIEVPETVAEDGTFYPHVPLFAGKTTYTPAGKPGDANPAVIAAIQEAGGLLARGRLVHSYPHSWRSKAPLIFRTTPQWFISMDHATAGQTSLRDKALKAIAETTWVPPQGRNRIESMIQNRPDWCISRQRAWGVPIAIFVRKADGKVLVDQDVFERIGNLFEVEGSDAWFARPAQDFLGDAYKAEDFEQVRDIVDVWFESGCTHSFVLELRPELRWPADIYLEGSDQHRGWFHSSLLESCGTRGRAPYDTVLTHGFTLDEQGFKMSKSAGNVVSPQDVSNQYGADILRLWVVSTDFTEDQRIGPEILKFTADTYRRLRNTLRYLLGALDGFDPAERIGPSEMPELERWVLHRVAEIDAAVRRSVRAHDYHEIYTILHNFCASDLSAFYFDIRKDSLYCDRPDSVRRRSARTVMDTLLSCLTAWLAPILCFTAEEAWQLRPNRAEGEDSVHLRTFPEVPEAWLDPALAARWESIRSVRRAVTGALELERASKTIGSSLQAAPVVHVEDEATRMLLADGDFKDIAITSTVTLAPGPVPEGAYALPEVPGVGVVFKRAEGAKCDRCWKVLPEVGSVSAHPTLCRRCADAVDYFDHTAA